MSRIVITGANGMLGSTLCQLYNENDTVYALHRDKICFALCEEHYSVDLMDAKELRRIIEAIRPDLVIHCAGLVNIEACERNSLLAYQANVEATENIIKCCGRESKIVYISTDQVYGDTEDYSEENLSLNPVNHYGRTKYQAEKIVLAYRPDSLIVRANIFGWNVKPGKVSSAEWIFNALNDGTEISLFSDYIFSPIYAGSLGNILRNLVSSSVSGIINIGSSKPCSKLEFGMYMAQLGNFETSVLRRARFSSGALHARRMLNLTLVTDKAETMKTPLPSYTRSLRDFLQFRQLKMAL
jgi:dTDP-4-dehydrorhamnose reductase